MYLFVEIRALLTQVAAEHARGLHYVERPDGHRLGEEVRFRDLGLFGKLRYNFVPLIPRL